MTTIYWDTPPKPSFINQVKTSFLPSKSWLKDSFPVLQWLPKYNRQWFYGDAICALTVGIVVMPQSMAYAKIAGLPPQYGLYSSVIGFLIYPWLGTSKDISIGTTAINSLFMGQITAILFATPEFQNGTWTISYITSNLTLITGLVCLLVSCLHLGILFDFICQPAIAGFLGGTAVTIVISQLIKILGLHGIKTTDPTYLMLGNLLKHLPETQWDAALGIPGLIFLYGTKYGVKQLIRRYPKYTKSLTFFNLSRNAIVIVMATLLSFLINHFGHFHESPFHIVKDVPVGFQDMRMPALDGALLSHVLPNLVGVVVLQIMEHCTIATNLGRAADYKIQVNQEITTIGIANVLGSFFGAYPMTGNLCRSAVMAKSGSRTPLANVGVGSIVLLSMYCFTPALQYIPEAAVGAIVCHAVSDLISGPKVWIKFWNTHPAELLIFASAFLIALFASIDLSVYVPVALSLVIQLYRRSRPKYAFLGRLDQGSKKNQAKQPAMYFPLTHPVLKARIHPISPAILCFQPRADLVFENATYLYGKLMDEVNQHTHCRSLNTPSPPPSVLSAIILDLSGVHMMDYAAMEALAQLAQAVDRACRRPVGWYFVVGSSPMVRHALLYAGFGNQQRKKNHSHGVFAFRSDIKKPCTYRTLATTTKTTTAGKDESANKQCSISTIEDVSATAAAASDIEKTTTTSSTFLTDPNDVYFPWRSYQNIEQEDDDRGLWDIRAMTAYTGPIDDVNDRYPYFFFSIHAAASAALQL